MPRPCRQTSRTDCDRRSAVAAEASGLVTEPGEPPVAAPATPLARPRPALARAASRGSLAPAGRGSVVPTSRGRPGPASLDRHGRQPAKAVPASPVRASQGSSVPASRGSHAPASRRSSVPASPALPGRDARCRPACGRSRLVCGPVRAARCLPA
jgi:hypothetical protein